MIRQFPEEVNRVETGPVRFGTDWTGLFIRGDNAYGYALHLQWAIDTLSKLPATGIQDHITLRGLRDLQKDLESVLDAQYGQS